MKVPFLYFLLNDKYNNIHHTTTKFLNVFNKIYKRILEMNELV